MRCSRCSEWESVVVFVEQQLLLSPSSRAEPERERGEFMRLRKKGLLSRRK